MVWDIAGGILGALRVLKDHWGPVERDLAAAHWSMAEFLEEQPLSAFISFIMYAPPGTAIYHVLNEGWTPDTHRLTDLVDIGTLLLWAKTVDGQENRNRPELAQRPGSAAIVAAPVMTIGDYMKLSGLDEDSP